MLDQCRGKRARVRRDTDSAIANPPSRLVKASIANRAQANTTQERQTKLTPTFAIHCCNAALGWNNCQSSVLQMSLLDCSALSPFPFVNRTLPTCSRSQVSISCDRSCRLCQNFVRGFETGEEYER